MTEVPFSLPTHFWEDRIERRRSAVLALRRVFELLRPQPLPVVPVKRPMQSIAHPKPGNPCVLLAMAYGACLTIACSDTQQFGHGSGDAERAPAGSEEFPSAPEAPRSPDGSRQWRWLNPRPTGEALVGIGGSSEQNVWLVGAHGTVLHWNGAEMASAYEGPLDARYSAVWSGSRTDVWLFGERAGNTQVLRLQGESWTEDLTLADLDIVAISAGNTDRLLIAAKPLANDNVLDWSILEYDRTTNRWDNLLDLPPRGGFASGIWIDETKTAWVSRRASRDFWRCGPRPARCEIVPIEGLDHDIDAFGVWGRAANDVRSFYATTSQKGPNGHSTFGVLEYDGNRWHISPDSKQEYVESATFHNLRMWSAAGTADGRHVARYGTSVVAYTPASLRKPGETAFPVIRKKNFYFDSEPAAVWSAPGGRVYFAGDMGGFGRLDAASNQWLEVLPSPRSPIEDLSFGRDESVFAFDRDSLLGWTDGIWNPLPRKYSYNRIRGVAALSSRDAWLADELRMGVTRWNGESVSATRSCCNGVTQAVWGVDVDDIWAAVLDHDPIYEEDPLSVRGRLCHGAAAKWTCAEVPNRIFAISGTSSSDVWFAGDSVMHWNGVALEPVTSLGVAPDQFKGVTAVGHNDVWLWGERAVHFDGTDAIDLPVRLNAPQVKGVKVLSVAALAAGDIYVLLAASPDVVQLGPRSTAIYRYQPADGQLILDRKVDAPLRRLVAHGNDLWAVGQRGATLRLTASPEGVLLR